MHGNEAEFLQSMSSFLGGFYATLAIMNGVAAFYVWEKLHKPRLALIWSGLGVFFLILSPIAFSGNPRWMALISVPTAIRGFVNESLGGPVVYSLGTVTLLIVLFLGRKFFVKPVVAWSGLNLTLLLMGLSMTNSSFAEIMTKPDNVPIVGLIFLLGFFTWLSASKAVINDERIARGLEPIEKTQQEKVLVWPDLVYTELICMIAITALLLVWGIVIAGPARRAR